MDDKHEHSDCGYGPLLASYIFDEATDDERRSLEAHFGSCASCADEVGLLAGVRREVVDWKVSEFDGLATPTIDLSAIAATPQRAVETPEPIGILTAITAFLSQWRTLALAGGSFAAIAMLVAGVYFASTRNSGGGLAARQAPSPTQTANTPAPRSQTQPSATPPAAVESSRPADSSPRTQPASATAPKSEKADVRKTAARPAAVRAATEPGRRKPAAKPATDGLNPLGEEEEDDGLRLADLFDEIGMK